MLDYNNFFCLRVKFAQDERIPRQSLDSGETLQETQQAWERICRGFVISWMQCKFPAWRLILSIQSLNVTVCVCVHRVAVGGRLFEDVGLVDSGLHPVTQLP